MSGGYNQGTNFPHGGYQGNHGGYQGNHGGYQGNHPPPGLPPLTQHTAPATYHGYSVSNDQYPPQTHPPLPTVGYHGNNQFHPPSTMPSSMFPTGPQVPMTQQPQHQIFSTPQQHMSQPQYETMAQSQQRQIPENLMAPHTQFTHTQIHPMVPSQQYRMPSAPRYPITQPQQGQMVQSHEYQMRQSPQSQLIHQQAQMVQSQQNNHMTNSQQPQLTQTQHGQMVQTQQYHPTTSPQPQQMTPQNVMLPEPQMTQPHQQMVQSPQNQPFIPPDHIPNPSRDQLPPSHQAQQSNIYPNMSSLQQQHRGPNQAPLLNVQVSHPLQTNEGNRQPTQPEVKPNPEPHSDPNQPPQFNIQGTHPLQTNEGNRQPTQPEMNPNPEPHSDPNQSTRQNQMKSLTPKDASHDDNASPTNPPSHDRTSYHQHVEGVQEVKPGCSESPNTSSDVDELTMVLDSMSLNDGNTTLSKASVPPQAASSLESKDSMLDASMNESTSKMDVALSSDHDKGARVEHMRSSADMCTILVGNLSPGSSEEDLRNYLEGWIDEDVVLVRYTRDHTQAVVTFKKEIVLQQDRDHGKPLDGRRPTVSNLEATNQLSVWGVEISSMVKDLVTHFQSKNSGNIDETVITGEEEIDGVLVLTFEDPRAVKNILTKAVHRLGERSFYVEEFYQRLREPVWNEGSTESLECPLQLVATRFLLVTGFLQKRLFKNTNIKAAIDEQKHIFEVVGPSLFVKFAKEELLQSCKIMASHTDNIELSRNKVSLLDNEVTGEYVMNKMIQNGIQGAWWCSVDKAIVRLVSTTDDGLRCTETIVRDSLVEAEIEAEDITDEQCIVIHHQVETRYPGSYFITHNQGNAILLVATDGDVESLKNAIQDLVVKMQIKEKERHQRNVQREQEEHMTSSLPLSPLKTKYMKLHMQEGVNQIQKQNNVRVCAEVGGFSITGDRYNCQAAIDDLRRLADKVKVKGDRREGQYMTELYEKDLISVITDYVEQEVDCAVEALVKGSETRKVSDDFSVHLLMGKFSLHSNAVMVPVDENFQPLGSIAQKILEHGGSQVKEECARYLSKHGCPEVGQVVMTTAGSVPHVHNIFHVHIPKRFESIEQEERVFYKAVMTSFVFAEEEELESIAVSITVAEEKSITSVTRWVAKALHYQFQNRVTDFVKTVFLLCEDRTMFEAYSKNSGIYLNFQEDVEEDEIPPQTEVSNKQSISVEVLKGDISKQNVDIIVNTVGRTLDLTRGNISKCLLSEGGDVLQQECRRRNPTGIREGQFAETSGGNLPCKRVYHCCLPFPSTYGNKYLQDFKKLILDVLNHACDSGLKSIAFPSLGTGNRGYHAHDVARFMFECIRLHKKTNPTTSVSVIRFVIYENDDEIYKVYKKFESEYNNKAHGTPRASPPEDPPTKSYAAAVGTIGSAEQQKWLAPQHQQQHQQQQKQQQQQQQPEASRYHTGSIKIKLVKGAITDQQVDVLVNSVNTGLDLKNGAVSASILKAGGSVIQEEVKARYGHTGVQLGQFVESGGGRLGCKRIYHYCLPGWSVHDEGNESVALLDSLVLKCLHKANEDGGHSIAFPAFGTGKLGYPKDQVAKTMYEAVAFFSREYKPRLADVRFVVYEKDTETISAFEKIHAVYEKAMRSSTRQGQEWKMKKLKIVVKQGDILAESCDTVVVTVSRSLDLGEGTVSGNLLKTERGMKLQHNCCEQKTSFDKHGWIMLDSNKTCAAKMLFCVNKEWVKSSQQQVILNALKINDQRGLRSLAFPILATGKDARHADALAKDLFSAVQAFPPAKTLQQVTVVVYQHEQLEVFIKAFSGVIVYDTPRRKAPAPPTHQQVVQKPRASSESAFFIPRREAPAPPTHQQIVQKPRASSESGAVKQAAIHKEPQVSRSTRVLYNVAASPESLGRALETLANLNTENKDFFERISDIRLKFIDRTLQREIMKLSKDDVNVRVSRKEMEIVVRGKSLEALQVLRDVMMMMSELPKRKTKPAPDVPKTLKNDQESPRFEDLSAPMTQEVSPQGITKSKALPSGKTYHDFSSSEGAIYVDHKSTTSMSENMGETYMDHKPTTSMSPDVGETYMDHKPTTSMSPDAGETYMDLKPTTSMTDVGDTVNYDAHPKSHGNERPPAMYKNMSPDVSETDKDHKSLTSMTDVGESVKYNAHSKPYGDERSPLTYENSHQENNDDGFSSGDDRHNQQTASTSLESSNSHQKELSIDDDTWEKLEKNEIQDMPSQDSKNTSSSEMNTNSSHKDTDESPENTTPITTDISDQDDPEPDTKVEWFFVNDTESGRELQSYESMNEKIESAYRRGDPSVVLPGEDEEYVIDFSTMEEYVKGCDEDRVSVVRREIIPESEVSLPAELKDLSGDSKLVLVDRTSEEFDNINVKFLKAAEPTKVSVVKIEKMLNVIVYQNYERKKKWIMRPGALTPGDHAERSLWHGPLSNTDSIVNLSSFGFNRSYCTSGGDLQCGEGVYFYPYIEDIVAKSKMDASGHHHVCLAKVLTGRAEQANTTAEDKRSTPKGFHSVVDLQSMPSKFVIFFDNQALPEYLVTFSVDQMDSRM